MTRHRGATLLEVLAALAVIGLLLGLLAPAVNAARESMRRVKCANNLRQLGVAMTGYTTVHGFFPPASYRSGPPGYPGAYSPHVMMLPHLDQAGPFDELNFNSYLWADGERGPENVTASQRIVGVFLCPSDAKRADEAGNNYRACSGFPMEGRNVTQMGGPFARLVMIEPAAVTDGLAHTAAFSERLLGDGDAVRYTPSRDVWFTKDPSLPPIAGLTGLPLRPADFWLDRCRLLPEGSFEHASGLGAEWFVAVQAHTLYQHVFVPNSEIPDCARHDQAMLDEGNVNARSFHPGGVNVVSCDGSVKFVTDSIDLAVWRALATRAGGESVALP